MSLASDRDQIMDRREGHAEGGGEGFGADAAGCRRRVDVGVIAVVSVAAFLSVHAVFADGPAVSCWRGRRF